MEEVFKEKYKVLFADLDGTLIETVSGDTFPKGIWDMRIRFDVLDAIKELEPICIFIVSNQGGIKRGFVNRRNFEFKMEYITRSIKEYVGCCTEYSYCESNDKANHYRKPNTGMLERMLTRALKHLFRPENLQKDDCLMIGDASGKEGQFSDSDKKTAENFGIDYMDVEDFVKEMTWQDEPVELKEE